MMELLNKQTIQELASGASTTCLSLYMPTHRSHPENLKDPIKFKNLLKQLDESLSQQYSNSEVKEFLKPFETLINDAEFWNNTSDGLAVLSADAVFKTIGLQVPVEELTVVANSFHTKPLRKYLQSLDRYHVLGISLHDIKLFEGNRHSLVEVKLPPDISKTIEEALGSELTDKHSTVASYGGVGGQSNNMHHGHGGKKEEVDIDAERFFRVISADISEHYSKPSGIPLILAALPEHHNLFHKVNNNPLLLPNSIHINYKAVEIDKLTAMAWEVMQPEYAHKLSGLTDKYEQAKANNTGSDDIKKVAEAAAAGRVGTLLIEADCIVAGKITDSNTGAIQMEDLSNPETDDLLDDIGELVTKLGGQVMVVPPEYMPTHTGLAAIFRY
ncbi:MAG: hypothetical protein ACSLE0_13905 [Chitinophagaceae bacterium]